MASSRNSPSCKGSPPAGVRLFVHFVLWPFFLSASGLSVALHSPASLNRDSARCPLRRSPHLASLTRGLFREGRQTKPSGGCREKTTMKTDKNSQTTTQSGTLPQPEQTVPDSKPHRIIHGDCVQELRKLPDASADLVFTDPPYLVRYKDRSGRTVANDDNTHWMYPAFSELFRVLKPNSYCMSFYGWNKADRFLNVWRECGFQPVGHFVWVKRYASCVRHSQARHEQAYLLAKGNPLPPKYPPADIIPWTYTGNKLHPTQKPVSSLMPIIQAYSKPNGLVLDPFAGSGSTGVASLLCRRRCLLIEKEAAHYQTAATRLDQLPYHVTAFWKNTAAQNSTLN